MQLDSVDLRILRELQADPSLSNVKLARRVHLSPSPCLARIKALRSSGLIRQCVALLDPAMLGLHLNVFISISLKQQTRAALEAFEAKVVARDEAMECCPMTGDADCLICVTLPDMAALERFILEQLSPMSEIEKIRSSFALKQVHCKTALPLAGGAGPKAASRPRARR